MAQPLLDWEERMELLTYLEALLGCVNSLHASVSDVLADVTAMRSTVLENPLDLAFCQANLHRAASTSPMVQEALRSDDWIADFAGTQRYKH